MAKRDIERALRKKGITAEHIEWVWTIAPEEHVPCWEVHLSDADADKFGEDHMHIFDNTTQAIEWAEQLEPYPDAAAPSPGESNNKPIDCSGDPSSCPDNEGRGCYCSDLHRKGESA